MASQLSEVDLDAHVVQLTMAGFSFVTVPLGVSIAATIRVGNLVGANLPDRAR